MVLVQCSVLLFIFPNYFGVNRVVTKYYLLSHVLFLSSCHRENPLKLLSKPKWRKVGFGDRNQKEWKPSQEPEIKVSLFTVAEFRNTISISCGSGIFTAAVASTLHSAAPLIRSNSAVMLSVPRRHRQSHTLNKLRSFHVWTEVTRQFWRSATVVVGSVSEAAYVEYFLSVPEVKELHCRF